MRAWAVGGSGRLGGARWMSGWGCRGAVAEAAEGAEVVEGAEGAEAVETRAPAASR